MTSNIPDQTGVDPLVEATVKLIDDPYLRKHVSRTLPNKGDDVEAICARGFERFDRDFDSLYHDLFGK